MKEAEAKGILCEYVGKIETVPKDSAKAGEWLPGSGWDQGWIAGRPMYLFEEKDIFYNRIVVIFIQP